AFECDRQMAIQAVGSWGPSTAGPSFSTALSGVVNKLLLTSWLAAGTTWQQICRQADDIPDFKTSTRIRPTALGSMRTLAPGGEIQHGQVDVEVYTQTVSTKAMMLGIDRTQIVNDDLHVIDSVPRLFAREAAVDLETRVYTALLQGGATFFTAG